MALLLAGARVQPDVRRPLVAGNWKMHGTLAEARERALSVACGVPALCCDVWLAPPVLHVSAVAECLAGSRVGLVAQDVSRHAAGAHTGEISAGMLVDAGCRGVIVGHSERRQSLGESDELVGAKALAACGAGLVPVVCVGETVAERDAGETAKVVLRQLDAVLALLPVAALAQLVLAYEPVWAIGTGRNATPEQAQEVHALLRQRVAGKDPGASRRMRILYGGSVKAGSAPALFAMPDVDGGLVGGASLDAREFLAICALAR